MPKDTTTKFKVDISELKKNITEANRLIRLNNSEFKAATAGMDKWSKSSDGLSAKLKQLDGNLSAEKTKLKSLEEQYKLVAKEQGENSKGAQDLLVKINNQRASVEKIESQISKYNDQLKEVKKKEEQAESATGKLTKSIQEQEEELKDLKEKYADVALTEGKNSDKAKSLKTDIEKLSKSLNDDKRALGEAKTSADKFDKSIDTVDKTTHEAGSESGGVSTLNVAMGNLAADGAKKVLDICKDLIEVYKDVDGGYDNLIKKTGATGDAAKELEKSYKDAAGEVVADFTDLGSAAGEINTRFGFTNKVLTDATVYFQKFANLNDVDVTTAVQKTAKAMANANIDSSKYAEFLDLITLAGQKTGVSVDALLDSYVTYGATFKSLNIDNEKSVALMAQAEKEGLDLNVVLRGLKTANTNLAKEGKSADKEMGKLFQSIKNAKNPTAATKKAIEIFGAKAGPDMAKAIREGKLSIDKMTKSLKNSKGTVKDTYEQTQDSTDKIGLAWQKAKVKISDFTGNLLKKYEPNITKAIDKIEKGGEDALGWIIENLDTIVPILKGIGQEIVIVFAANKISSFTSSIANGVSTFKNLASATDGATRAQKLLNIAQENNPIGMVITVVGTLITGFMTLSDVMGTADEDARNTDLKPDVEETTEAIQEVIDKYNDYKEAKDDAISDTASEWDYYQKLWEELQGIVDQNGKVKEGYETRAKFINGELKKALGVEIKLTKEGVIKEYDNLINKIDELMLKKRALAQQETLQADYTTAKNNVNESKVAYAQAQNKYDEKQKEIDKQQKLVDSAYKKWKSYKPKGVDDKPGVKASYERQYNTLNQELEDLKEEQAKNKKQLDEATAAYDGYRTAIYNYENISEAILSGNEKKIKKALSNIENDFATSKTATEITLKAQYDSFKKQYNDIKTAVANGVDGITQADVDRMKKLVDKSKAEWDKAKKANKKGAKDSIDEAEKTIDDKSGTFSDKIKGLFEKAKKAIKKSDSKSVGKNWVSGLINGIKNPELTKELEETAANMGKRAYNSIKKWLKIKSPSRKTAEIGRYFMQGFEMGVEDESSTTIKNTNKKFGELIRETEKTLNNGVKVNGIYSSKNIAVPKIQNPGSGTTVVNNYYNTTTTNTKNLTQNNSSPEPLSNLEIYRKTKEALDLL